MGVGGGGEIRDTTDRTETHNQQWLLGVRRREKKKKIEKNEKTKWRKMLRIGLRDEYKAFLSF